MDPGNPSTKKPFHVRTVPRTSDTRPAAADCVEYVHEEECERVVNEREQRLR